ncbi:MAG: hypothetical protein IJO20_02920 [Ruminococcus sp.]|nr:hypothetical protein [Ruminococcus sp.]
MMWLKNEEKIKSVFKNSLSLCLSVLAIFCALRYSKACSDGVIAGLSLCVTTLVPSLFIFMVIAQYISTRKAIAFISVPLGKIVEKTLNLPKESVSVLILSLIGGYPIGARCVATLYECGKLNHEQARKLSLIAVSSGPGFVINFVGSALLQNKSAGVIVLASELVAFFVVALLVGRFVKVNNESVVVKENRQSTDIVASVESACKGCINMCALVIAFTALVYLCDEVFRNYPSLCKVLSSILEVTTACTILADKYPLYIISAIIGFGGICVHAQVFSALENITINKLLFFLCRTIQGITAGTVTYILLILFPQSAQVFSSVESAKVGTTTSLAGSVMLVLTAICFLNSISKTKLLRR